MLRRIALVCGISAVGFAQTDHVVTATEVLADTLKDLRGLAEWQKNLFVNPWSSTLVPIKELIVEPRLSKEKPQAAVISVGRLTHKVPSNAVKAYRRGRALAAVLNLSGA